VTLWQGRLQGGMAAELVALSESLDYDVVLAADDVRASHAHVEGLVRAGILTEGEAMSIHAALEVVGREIASGEFVRAPGDEDVHTAIERRVTEVAGAAGAKLHTGRSRNDQVATDLRLWTRRSLAVVAAKVILLQEALYERACSAADAYLPGYTHLQRAQPVLLSHHLAAHCWALARDVDRLCQSIERLNVSPLGAGALAGSSIALDPDATARALAFSGRFENSLDAVSDRDFVAEALFDVALLGIHLSRMGEEVVLWTSEEFGFAVLDDAFATGSSMLPQKKNADIAELARGKSGRLVGNLTGLMVTLKGLPLAYNRDLQEDKEPLFDSVEQVGLVLDAFVGMYTTMSFRTEAMAAAADRPTAAAVDLAEYLVQRGVPFRAAHGIVGGLVAESLVGEVSFEDLVRAHPELGEEAARLLGPGVAVTRRTTPGGAGPEVVAAQMERLRSHLDAEIARVAGLPR
jgi:argininosuccinate lyase